MSDAGKQLEALARGTCRKPDIWLPDIVERFAAFLHPNDVSCSLRLVNKATAALFRGQPQFTTVRISLPVPHHAFKHRWAAPGSMRPLKLHQRRQLLRLTAASGSIPNLQLALDAAGIAMTDREQLAILKAAAVAGKVEMCEWLLQREFHFNSAVAAAAARAGQQAVCELLLPRAGAVMHADMVVWAARGGHTELVEWLLQRRPEGPLGPTDSLRCLDTDTRRALIRWAAEGCDLATLQKLLRRCYGDQACSPHGHHQVASLSLRLSCYQALEAAVCSPTPDWQAKAEWLESLLPAGYGGGDTTMLTEAAAGAPADTLARLQWLRQRGYPVGDATVRAAAAAGNVAAVEYLLTQPGVDPEVEEAALEAAVGGHVPVLAVFHAQGRCMSGSDVAMKAMCKGHLPAVEWAIEVLGTKVRKSALLEAAAGSGSVELMAWAHQRGARRSAEVVTKAARSGCGEALEWAAAHGCPMPVDGEPYLLAAENGDLATLRSLRRLGCPPGPAERYNARLSHLRLWGLTLPVLQCLDQVGCPVDWGAAADAAMRQHCDGPPDVKAWLAERWQQARQQRRPRRKQAAPRGGAAPRAGVDRTAAEVRKDRIYRSDRSAADGARSGRRTGREQKGQAAERRGRKRCT